MTVFLSRSHAFLILLVLSLVFTNNAFGTTDSRENRRIVFGSESTKGFYDHQGGGIYIDLLKTIYQPRGYQVTFEIMPYKRLRWALQQEMIDAIVGTYAEKHIRSMLETGVERATPHYPIDTETVVAFCNHGRYSSWEEARNSTDSKYAWVRGYSFHRLLEIPKRLVVENSVQGVKMLNANRLDCLLENENSFTRISSDLNLPNKDFSQQLIAEKNLYVLFQGVRHQQLASEFDEGVERLIETQEIFRLYNKWGLDYNKVRHQNPTIY